MGTSPAIVKADFTLDGDLKFSIAKDADADSTAEKDVMAGPCRITNIRVDNNVDTDSGTQTVVYLKLYDDLNPTVGTTAPDYIFEIPADQQVNLNPKGGKGIKFVNGLSYAVVQEPGTAGTTDPATNTTVTVTMDLLPGVG